MLVLTLLMTVSYSSAQPRVETPTISSVNFTAFNRKASYERGEAHLDANADNGILWLNGSLFGNGVIELELKGRDIPGQSFVGVAFHGRDDKTFDAVYFRPFNFRHPERNGHSVQYVSLPGNDWSLLRERFPNRYENRIDPVPDPVDAWFHVRIVVNYPDITVYVNHASRPTLEVRQLSDQKEGALGFWVGNGSEGWFRNLKITHQ
ncbi:family 16 glycoside hydrolase [Parapedobacter sp. DT-150]|uniref:family 16 glycoside hydrolase n=1 Tax=Parapedobacter sp. DT-150 TaxID=3396162 RepID=UPI003F1D19D7